MAGTFAPLIPFILIVVTVAKLEEVPTKRLDDIDANVIKELMLLAKNDLSTQEVLSETVDIERSLKQYDDKVSETTESVPEGGAKNVREKRDIEDSLYAAFMALLKADNDLIADTLKSAKESTKPKQ